MHLIEIYDTDIFTVNGGKQDNVSDSIIYRGRDGERHTIDFAVCVENYKSEHMQISSNCIGERNIEEGYFLFYTSGIKTKVIFKKKYVYNVICYHLLSGLRDNRFQQLQKMIGETKYTTRDLS